MLLSSDALLDARRLTALGRRFSVLEIEVSDVELERHKESSSKSRGSTLLKISVKWPKFACKISIEARCRSNMMCRSGHCEAHFLQRNARITRTGVAPTTRRSANDGGRTAVLS
jgi:hypothetical protein